MPRDLTCASVAGAWAVATVAVIARPSPAIATAMNFFIELSPVEVSRLAAASGQSSVASPVGVRAPLVAHILSDVPLRRLPEQRMCVKQGTLSWNASIHPLHHMRLSKCGQA